ncbi:hypothetical protein BDF20DRAFT_832981 [Mycotypha africana]|uniref:uncharacterized protein n=1 Tax=Mycotypha africana TaxID=64632 RepID=UPI0023013F3A|nr:uncharacterized protein BDF20DRAFT_832981 [Mycotypha africana]KAI8988103.1 hypothetical protein BDF20DRAFT_832981 [Mycotypha africana]
MVQRVCPVCQTTKFKKSKSTLVCKYGHQILDYVVEEGEDGMGSGRERKRARNIKSISDSGYTPLEQRSNWIKMCHYALKVMTRCMVQELGFSRELEITVRKLWMLYLSHAKIELADAYAFDVDSSNTAEDEERLRRLKESDLFGNEDADDAHNAEALLEESDTESDSDIDKEEEKTNEPNKGQESNIKVGPLESMDQKKQRQRWKAGRSWPSLTYVDTLAFLYLACIYLHYPIIVGDFVRWCKTEQLPFLQMQEHIPEDILSHAGERAHRMTVLPNSDYLLKRTRRYAFCFIRLCKVIFPPVNIHLLLNRFCDQFHLPVAGYYYAYHLYRRSNLKHEHDFSKARHQHASTVLMACVLATAKLFYGVVDNQSHCKLVSEYNPGVTKGEWLSKIRANLNRWKQIDKDVHSLENIIRLLQQGFVKHKIMAHQSDKQFLPLNVFRQDSEAKNVLRNRQASILIRNKYDVLMKTESTSRSKGRLPDYNDAFDIGSILETYTHKTIVEEPETGLAERTVVNTKERASNVTGEMEEPVSTASKDGSRIQIGEMFYTKNESLERPSPKIYLDLISLANYILACDEHDSGIAYRLRRVDKKIMADSKSSLADPSKVYLSFE